MINEPIIEQLRSAPESQEFDRKSARIEPKALANHLVAFANADGGTIVVGIEDNGAVTGIDKYTQNINELQRVPIDYCNPSVRVDSEKIDCVNVDGKRDHLLVITVFQSTQMHANQADEVYYRMGDKSKKLSFEDRIRLMYAKGERYYEDTPVPDATIDDIDLPFVQEYIGKIGYTKSPVEYLKENNDFISTREGREVVSVAAILLFGKSAKHFFPRARVRFIRYEGTVAKIGAEMNVIKDMMFEGRILQIAEKSEEFVRGQIKEHTFLGPDTRFVTHAEYPEYAWKELIVNAIAHRDYSIKGTDIQIKMFDDRLSVESPGSLPGIVRLSNMRHVHFSRNPKIAEFLQRYGYVREFGEGVDRLYDVMESAGLPHPEYKVESFMLIATLRNKASEEETTPQDRAQDRTQDGAQDGAQDDEAVEKKILTFCIMPRSCNELLEYCGFTSRSRFRVNYLKPLIERGALNMTIPDKPNSKNQKYVTTTITT